MSVLSDVAEVPDHRESAADYARIVARLSDRWRVIVCRDGIQWIIQRRDGERCGRARWTGRHYCTTRDALLRLCRASCPRIDPSASQVLMDLPAHIREQVDA